jgi:hypothetical protein
MPANTIALSSGQNPPVLLMVLPSTRDLAQSLSRKMPFLRAFTIELPEITASWLAHRCLPLSHARMIPVSDTASILLSIILGAAVP